jgi:methionine synthase II (cobalamin-independent)
MRTLSDQIWREDIIDQQEVAADCARVLNAFVQRATYQGAPPALIAKLTRLRDLNAEVNDELEEIKLCFPSQPQR